MTKILINKCYGGFNLPDEFYKALEKEYPETYKKYAGVYENVLGKNEYFFEDHSLAARTDKNIVSLFERMYPEEGSAQTRFGNVVIVEIDDEKYPNWWFTEYDGFEGIELEPPKNHGFSEEEEDD